MPLFRRQQHHAPDVEALEAQVAELQRMLNLTGGQSIDTVAAGLREAADATRASAASAQALQQEVTGLAETVESFRSALKVLHRRLGAVEPLPEQVAQVDVRAQAASAEIAAVRGEIERQRVAASAEMVTLRGEIERQRVTADGAHSVADLEVGQLRETLHRHDVALADGRSAAEQALRELDSRTKAVTTDLDARINAVTTDLDARMNGVTADVDARINGVTADVEARVNRVTTELQTQMGGLAGDLESRMGGLAGDLETLRADTAAAQATTAARLDSLDERAASAAEVAAEVGRRNEAAEQRIAGIEQAQEQDRAGLAALERELHGVRDRLRAIVDEVVTAQTAVLQGRVEAIESATTLDRAQLTALAGLMGGLRSDLDGALSHLETIERRAATDRTALAARFEDLANRIDESRGDLESSIGSVRHDLDEKITGMSSTLGKQIGDTTTATKTVTTRFDDFARGVSGRLAKIEEATSHDREFAEEFQAERLEELERMVEEINPDHFVPRDWWAERFGTPGDNVT
jgi:chromosome segregation ATPase